MKIQLSDIVIAAMYAALIGYSVWHMLFSKTAIFKSNQMESTKFDNDISRFELTKKLARLKNERETKEAELVADYNPEKLRELHIIDHHIEVAEQRISGNWYPEAEQTVQMLHTNNLRK